MSEPWEVEEIPVLFPNECTHKNNDVLATTGWYDLLILWCRRCGSVKYGEESWIMPGQKVDLSESCWQSFENGYIFE
ncbi:MAG: hypothetical protein HYX21_01470 [Candidatus Yanofskybacteria bacterium]|nr:hypothetical protein [Candidatus Yanofskybacteria bacterium]